MPEAVSAARRPISRPLLLAAAIFGMLVAAAAMLWVHFGTAVFFETIVAGISACF